MVVFASERFERINILTVALSNYNIACSQSVIDSISSGRLRPDVVLSRGNQSPVFSLAILLCVLQMERNLIFFLQAVALAPVGHMWLIKWRLFLFLLTSFTAQFQWTKRVLVPNLCQDSRIRTFFSHMNGQEGWKEKERGVSAKYHMWYPKLSPRLLVFPL